MPSGQVVVAGEQTAGRGRHGRSWTSPPGNLYASVLLRPSVPAASVAQLSLVAGLAMADAIGSLLPDPLQVAVKWPNDVLVDGAKVAGLLLETASSPAGTVDWAVIGSGVNIRHHPEGMPYRTTALVYHAPGLTADDLLVAYIDSLRGRVAMWEADGFGALRRPWLERSFGFGQPLRVRLPRTEINGRFIDLTEGGALVLEDEAGRRLELQAGDIVLGGS